MEEELPNDVDEEVPFEVGLAVVLLDGARGTQYNYRVDDHRFRHWCGVQSVSGIKKTGILSLAAVS